MRLSLVIHAGIPIVKHKEHGCYVATMIFGQLLTVSSTQVVIIDDQQLLYISRGQLHSNADPFSCFYAMMQGSNFDDDEKKTTGGRNGYGAKLANIFSKKFTVECLDAEKGLKFSQTWRNNMHKAEDPVVERCSSSEERAGDYVRITFKPDFARFNMGHLDEDAVGLISKRAYDVSIICVCY